MEKYRPTPQEAQNMKMKPDALKVSGDRMFATIQGEGDSIGKPATFLRLNFCNLACDWCDTKYTWDSTKPEYWKEASDMNYQQVAETVFQNPSRRLVITGGEPLIQQDKISKLLEFLPGVDIEIETNGTIEPSEGLKDCQFNVSPKLSNSGNSKEKRYKPNVLRKFNDMEKSFFKFVVEKPEDLEEVDEIIKDCDLKQEKIIIMPEGTNQDAIQAHALAIQQEVEARGWRLLPRMQVMLWGSKRGV